MKVLIRTGDGDFVACYTENGLCGLEFPGGSNGAKPTTRVPAQVRKWHPATVKAVRAVLAGRRPGRLPPLDLSAGTSFQQQVWRVLSGIAAGSTLSYGQVARALRKPGAARAVGAACGANPVPLLVPCHRVLAANRRLGGFSGGLNWKRTLLAREGVVLS